MLMWVDFLTKESGVDIGYFTTREHVDVGYFTDYGMRI